MKSRTALFFNALLVIVFVFVFTMPASAGKTYKLGMSLAITGPHIRCGKPLCQRGGRTGSNSVNETDYLGDGDKIDCPIRDDQYKNDVTKRFFEEFLDDGILIFLSYATGGNLALKRDFEEVKIPVIPASYHEGLIVDANYTFMPVATYSENAVGLAEYITENHKGDNVPRWLSSFIRPHSAGAAGRHPESHAEGMKIEIVEVVEHGTDLDNTAMLQRLVSKGVQYVICQTVQTPVATMLTDAQRLGVNATTFGEKDKLTFLGAHYTGGSDLIALAGTATEGYIWADSYNLTSENNEGAKKQLELAERYGRDDKAANSHNYGAGILAAQIATEAIKMAKEAGLKVNRENLYNMLQKMNFNSFVAAGPVTYSETERIGVDVQNIYIAQDGVFKKSSPLNPSISRKSGPAGKPGRDVTENKSCLTDT